MAGPQPASRRLPLWFAAATVPATLALVWLAWLVVRQDRLLARERHQTEREQAADIGVAALAQTLAEFESALGSPGASIPAAAGPPLLARIPILVFDDHGVVARAGLMLPYCPAVSRPAVSLPAPFTLADDLEFAKGDARGAVRVVLPLIHDDQSAIRAEAWLRLARNYRKSGEVDRAVDAFRELAALGDTMVQGVPAGLMGRQGRCVLFKAAGRLRELQQEAAGLSDDLSSGRWRLTPAQFEYSAEQVADWLGPETGRRLGIAGERADLLAAADAAWREGLSGGRRDFRQRRTIQINQQSVLVLARAVPEGMATMLVSAAVLREAWQRNLPGAAAAVDFALTDEDGHDVIGRASADQSRQAVRTTPATGLPWTVTATNRAPIAGDSLSTSATLMLAGAAIMVIIVVLSGYASMRAVSKEMRVARLQADFVAAVSHEFRTPLTTIRQLSEMLARSRVSTEARQQQFHQAILKESERLQRLVEGLLDFGRMEAGHMAYRLETLDLGSLVQEVAEHVSRDTASTGHRIEVDSAEPLPAVLGDRDALGYAIRNLLDNAVKYSPDNKIVHVRLSNANGRVAIHVRDRGLGIPTHEQREIFEKFVRGATSSSRNIAGTGVGLAMARQIVDAHHGTISVESTPGEGSTFTIDLPAEPAARV